MAISNMPLRHDDLGPAVASRVVQLEHEPSDPEIAAFMRKLAQGGYKSLTPEQCQEIVAFVIEETRSFDERLDLRHMTKAFEGSPSMGGWSFKDLVAGSRSDEHEEDDRHRTDNPCHLEARRDRPSAKRRLPRHWRCSLAMLKSRWSSVA